jgi:hypothetical protein
MRLSVLCLVLVIGTGCVDEPADTVGTITGDHLEAWVGFSPSRALAAGRVEAVPRIEDFDQARIDGWLAANRAARDGFYRSFNTAFNTMIISHEIYLGHYLQLKAAAGHPFHCAWRIRWPQLQGSTDEGLIGIGLGIRSTARPDPHPAAARDRA